MSFNRSDCMFYNDVPKDRAENIKYRQRLHQMLTTGGGRGSLDQIKEACRRDPLFFINTFCWTYDPREEDKGGNPVIPFITFDLQDEMIHEIFESLGKRDMLIEKSRDAGASWCCLMTMAHQFMFEHNQQFGVVSSKRDLVDKTGSKDCLFWKVEFMFKYLPWYLKPKYTHNECMLMNDITESAILGEAATGDAFRGGRSRAMFLDEFATFSRDDGYKVLAATADVTNCRIFNSTPKGTGNAFFDVRENIKSGHNSDGKILRFHWSDDERKNKGLYTNGKGYKQLYPGAADHDQYGDQDVVFLKFSPTGREVDEMKFDSDYSFILDGKIRSPWYDRECRRRAHPMLVAQELDIDYHNSSFRFFDEAAIQKVMESQVRDPDFVGEFVFDNDDNHIEFEKNEDGLWKLWYLPADKKMTPLEYSKFVIAADISAGTGASNSCLTVCDKITGEKVAEYANPRISPEDFGRYAVKIAKIFNEAFLIWENNGPGRNFGQKVLDAQYMYIYRRKDDVSITYKVTDIPGWASSPEKKHSLLSEYRDALNQGKFSNPSYDAMNECREYVNLPGDKVEHSATKGAIDPTGAGKSHGDRVIADALAWKAVKDSQTVIKGEDDEESLKARYIPPNSMKARLLKHEEQERRDREEFQMWS